METKTTRRRLLSLLLSLMTALMCLNVSTTAAVSPFEQNRGSASKMTWEVENVKAAAGADVNVNIIANNPVSLSSINDLGLVVEGDITPVSVTSNIGGTVTYSVSGNEIKFSLTGAHTASNGGVALVAKFHVNDGCGLGYYKVSWDSMSSIGTLSDGSAYYPLYDYGYIHVTQASSNPTTTTTTTSITDDYHYHYPTTETTTMTILHRCSNISYIHRNV